MNPLPKAVRDYLALRRGLGFKLVRHKAGLREFVSFLAQKRASRITVDLALEWATQHAHQKPYEWAARLNIVRGFARHWSGTDPATEVPPLGLLPLSPAAPRRVFRRVFKDRSPRRHANELADHAVSGVPGGRDGATSGFLLPRAAPRKAQRRRESKVNKRFQTLRRFPLPPSSKLTAVQILNHFLPRSPCSLPLLERPLNPPLWIFSTSVSSCCNKNLTPSVPYWWLRPG